jgi:hypothetical protein
VRRRTCLVSKEWGRSQVRATRKFDGSLVGYRVDNDLQGGGCIVVILLNVGAFKEVPLITVGEVLGVKMRRERPEPWVVGGKRREGCQAVSRFEG